MTAPVKTLVALAAIAAGALIDSDVAAQTARDVKGPTPFVARPIAGTAQTVMFVVPDLASGRAH